MSGLLDSLIGLASPQIVNALASRLGENESAVKGGLQSALATVLGSVASKSGDSNILGQIFSLITGPASLGILGNISSLAASGPSGAVSDMGQKLLSVLLGSGGQNDAVSAIAKSSGVSSASAASILGMAAPLVMGFLGNRVKKEGLNAATLGNQLVGELPAIQSLLLPVGLGSIATGLGSVAAMAAGASGGASSVVSSVSSAAPARKVDEVPASNGNWLVPLLLSAVALAGLFWFFSMGSSSTPASAPAAAVKEVASTATGAAKGLFDALGEFFKRKLPNGIEVSIPKLGVENKLIAFIEDASLPVDKTTWFNFDRLLFDTGKATLQPASQEQLANIAAILKAFPAVEIKLGGYTDNRRR